MQAVVQFSKMGSARYVSHLDTLRMMQRAFRRAEWPLAYSQGYHPHPQMSFAMALPVGAQAKADLLQVELHGSPDLSMLKKALDQTMPPGFCVSALAQMPDKTALTTLVAACDWYFTFPAELEEQVRAFADFLQNADRLIAVKQGGKKPGKEVECRAGMTGFEVVKEEEDVTLHLNLRASQEDYVQPGLVMSLAPQALQDAPWELTRGVLFTRAEGRLYPVLSMCKDITFNG